MTQKQLIKRDVEAQLSKYFGKHVEVSLSGSVGGGCINNASLLKSSEGEFFIKWNASCPADIFIQEATSLKELKKAAEGKLIIPEVLAAKEVNDTPGFLVLEYLTAGIREVNTEEKLGHGLAAIHKFTHDSFGFYSNNYCGSTPQDNSWKTNWIEFFSDNRLGYLIRLIERSRSLPADDIRLYDRLLGKITELLPKRSVPVLIHGDLWSGNYMITAKGPALIDPASYYADREMEMGIMTMFGGFSSRFYDAYEEVNPLPAGWTERNRLYQLYHVLNHYYLFGGSYRNQARQIALEYV